MKNKKIIIIVIISFIVGGIFNNLIMAKNNVYIPREITKKGTFKNALSMMLETDLDSGEYERSTSSTWPTEGYIFNKELSKCENGGELDWDAVNNQVLMIGASSDKCYVYFDKYTSVVINNLSLTSTPTSITATVTATAGSASISKYMFSINNGAYIESDSNVHTFVGLNSSTEYTVNVKVIDTNGRSSAISSETIETNAYVNPTITNLTTSVTSNSIKVTPVITQGTGTISKYYYSKDGGSSYTESTSNNYTFTGLTAGVTYSIKVYVTDNAGKASNTYTKLVTTSILLATYIKGLYTSQGANGIYLHNSTLANSAGDNSYRYAGSNPNNYVCFGSDATTCPNDNLYRIIGIFGDQVKLIKSDFVSSTQLGKDGAYSSEIFEKSSYSNYKGNLSEVERYYWTSSSNGSNVWSESALNTTNLNKNYITSLGNTWTNKIATTTWKVGGNTYANMVTSTIKNIYINEISSPAASTTYSAKIGLMYLSDYAYAAPPVYWTYIGYVYNDSSKDYRAARSQNWIFTGMFEWTISPRYGTTDHSYRIMISGYFDNDIVNNFAQGIRPCFYLNSNVTYTGGTGSSSNPYRLS